jgi:hypothetical protein
LLILSLQLSLFVAEPRMTERMGSRSARALSGCFKTTMFTEIVTRNAGQLGRV